MAYTKQNFTDNSVLTAENLKKMEEGILERIPSPPVAAVGQTIVVSEVDEEGKPIKWKADNATRWELISNIEITEPVSNIIIDTDMDGNSFKLKGIYVYAHSVLDPSSINYGGYSVTLKCVTNPLYQNSAYSIGLIGSSIKESGVDSWSKCEHIGDVDWTIEFGLASSSDNGDTVKHRNGLFDMRYGNNVARPDGDIFGINIATNNPGGVFWGVGSKIRIYGVRV